MRDIDLLSHAGSTDEALAELKRLAAVDLDDFLTYSFAHAEAIKAEDEYREGHKVFFIPYLGATAKQEVSIDLVVDQIVCESPEKMVPRGRLEVGDLKVFDYLLYPVASAMADKICATMQLFEGHESSRIKDLVDLTIFLTTQSFDAETLRKQVELEAALRKMEPIENYKAPQSWFTSGKERFSNLAKETGLSSEYHDIKVSYFFVSKCIDEVLSGKVDGNIWSPQRLVWV